MNKDTYDRLPDSVKAVIYDLRWNWAHAFDVQVEMDQELATFEECERLGVTLIELSPEMKAKWKEIVNPAALLEDLVSKHEAEGLPARELVQRYQDIVTAFEPYTTYVPVLGRGIAK